MAARPSKSNPLDCFLRRQIDDRINHCRKLVSSRISESENLFRKDLLSHYGCVNAIEFSPQGDLLVSGGDDRRILLWKVEQAIRGVGKPMAMRAQHGSNIFCLGYDSGKTKIFSAGNDDQVIVHNLITGDPINYFLHEKPVYGLSIHPHNDNVFSSACDDGRILVFDIRDASGTEPFCLARYKSAFHSVMFNPAEPRTLATANASEGISLWDVRKPLTPVLRYGTEGPTQGCMNVRFNSAGTRLLALRRRLPPVLYATDSPNHLCHFDQPGYYNSCTMKSCCFAGDDDEYVLSGSDDFNLYMWKIPSDEVKWVNSAHMILRGHRSIVNQVRYNRASCILASSGVEKIIKIWSPFPLCNICLGGLKRDSGKQERQRRVFTHEEYTRLVLRSGQIMTHDYSHQSIREDPRMMAFFDSLVQKEIEGWGSDTPAAQRSLTEAKNTSTTGQTQSATDSDDSTASAHRLMRTVLGATARNSSLTGADGGVTPERSIDSPNRITRLIGNRREKLMRLAALEAGAQIVENNSLATINDDAASDFHEQRRIISDDDEETASAKRKCKYKRRAKGPKRKFTTVTSRKSRSRRKCVVHNNLKLPTDSDSENEQTSVRKQSSDSENELFLVDGTQPSTSSGMSSRRSRYAVTSSLTVDSDNGCSSRSSCETETEDPTEIRRKRLRTDDGTTSRNNRRRNWKLKNRRDTVKPIETDENGKNGEQDQQRKTNSKRIDWQEYTNGTTIDRDVCDVKSPVTPAKQSSNDNDDAAETSAGTLGSLPPPPTPDSGIASGISTVEKNFTHTENSDHDVKLKNLESFKKKIDVARRGYRKRNMSKSKFRSSIATDSSD